MSLLMFTNATENQYLCKILNVLLGARGTAVGCVWFPRKQNHCVQTLLVFPNSTGTPESHLVASNTLCELQNPVRPKPAALYGMDLINSAGSRPTPPVDPRQPAGTEYRPPLGSEKLTEIEAVCRLYQNLTFFFPPPLDKFCLLPRHRAKAV